MYYLIICLKREEYEEDMLLAMASAGIFEAVVLEGASARETMAKALPIFAGFSADLSGGRSYTKVITAVLDNSSILDNVLEELRSAGIDFQQEEVGNMALLPVERFIGGAE